RHYYKFNSTGRHYHYY
nr:Chain A, Designed peptide BH33 [synthetic construct]